jgi:hypothetical protein
VSRAETFLPNALLELLVLCLNQFLAHSVLTLLPVIPASVQLDYNKI